jgi:hypothetical protein
VFGTGAELSVDRLFVRAEAELQSYMFNRQNWVHSVAGNLALGVRL